MKLLLISALAVVINHVTLTSAGTVLEEARANGCGDFVDLVDKAGLTSWFDSQTDVTLFAPTVTSQHLKSLMFNGTIVLEDALKYHLVSGIKMAADIKNDELVDTFEELGAKLRLNVYKLPLGNSLVTAEGSAVSSANIVASNGIVHIIENSLDIPRLNIPASLVLDQDLKSFGYLVSQTLVMPSLIGKPFTVFAPSQKALDIYKSAHGDQFQRILANFTVLSDVVKYHIVPGTYFKTAFNSFRDQGPSVTSLTTLQGDSLMVRANPSATPKYHLNYVSVDDINEIHTTNGVILEIDALMFPAQYDFLNHCEWFSKSSCSD